MHARNLFLTIHDKYFVIDVKMNGGVSIERRASKNSGNGNGFGSWLEERTKPTSLSAAINKEDRIKGLENGLNSSYEHWRPWHGVERDNRKTDVASRVDNAC